MNAGLKIRHDDARLAHGVVRSSARELIETGERAFAKLQKLTSMEKFMAGALAHFGPRVVVARRTAKMTGHRARLDMVAFEPTAAGHFSGIRIWWRGDIRPCAHIGQISVVFDKHCIARYLQRTAGNSDVDAALRALFPYVAAAMKAMQRPGELKPGEQIRVTGPEGQLRINPDEDYLVCKTWVSDRTAPEITVEILAGDS